MFSILTFTIAQYSPKLSESCASCPLLWHILRRLLVSPCAHDSPFLSSHLSTILLSPHQYLKRRTRVSKCYSTQVRPEMGREKISSALFSLHPFFLSKTLILNLFVSPSSPRDSLGFLLSLSGWAMSALSLCFLGGSTLTLGSTGRCRGLRVPLWLPVHCQHRASSFNDLAIQPLLKRSRLSDSHVPLFFRVSNSCSNGTATQALGGETKSLEHLSGETHSPRDEWWVNIWRMHTSVTSQGLHTDVDISGTVPVWRPRGSFDAQHEFCVPFFLSTELSHRPASDYSRFQRGPGHQMICTRGRSHC